MTASTVSDLKDDNPGTMYPKPVVVSINAKAKLANTPWQFTPGAPLNSDYPYDGKDHIRFAFQYIEQRIDACDYERLVWAATRAGFPVPSLRSWAEQRGLNGLKIHIDWYMVDAKGVFRTDSEGVVWKWNFPDGNHPDEDVLYEWARLLGYVPPDQLIQGAFKFYDGDDYAKDFIGGPELVEDVLPAVGVAMVYGESGSGKTFWILDLAFHVQNGAQWRDKDVAHGNAFYIAAEAGRSVKKRIHGVKTLNPDWKAPFVADIAPDLSSAQSIAAIRAAIGKTKATVVIVDTLSASFEGDDSSQQDTSKVIRNLKALSEGLGCLVVFVHHSRKDGGSFRGSGVLLNDVDAVVEITTEGEGGNRVHTARVTKVRDGEQGARYSFRLVKSAPLALKPNGKAVTTCTVVQADDTYGNPASVPASIQNMSDIHTALMFDGPVTVGALIAELLKQDSTIAGDPKKRSKAKFNAKEALRKHRGLKNVSDLPDDMVLYKV